MAHFVRSFDQILQEKDNNEGLETQTTIEQAKLEKSVVGVYDHFFKMSELDPDTPILWKQKHIEYLLHHLSHLPASYECLDSSRPWLCYWALHPLALMDSKPSAEDCSKVVDFLKRCQAPEGGYGGGPGQFPHLAPTYAAVNALCTIATEEAYNSIDRENLQRFLWSVKQPDGSFCMHYGGESDIRGAYCALDVAKLTNVYTPELFDNTAEWIVRCQTYEGGFGARPGLEAHGGYSFCGLGALYMLNRTNLIDLSAFSRWITNRQMRLEGGFQGRTNKLVDGCYSFWQGGAFVLLHELLLRENKEAVSAERWLFHQEALQEYILICCQISAGGLVDKPSKPRDLYHTCYTLSGLSIAQHSPLSRKYVVGETNNLLRPTHPVHNICMDEVLKAQKFFESLPVPNARISHQIEEKENCLLSHEIKLL